MDSYLWFFAGIGTTIIVVIIATLFIFKTDPAIQTRKREDAIFLMGKISANLDHIDAGVKSNQEKKKIEVPGPVYPWPPGPGQLVIQDSSLLSDQAKVDSETPPLDPGPGPVTVDSVENDLDFLALAPAKITKVESEPSELVELFNSLDKAPSRITIDPASVNFRPTLPAQAGGGGGGGGGGKYHMYSHYDALIPRRTNEEKQLVSTLSSQICNKSYSSAVDIARDLGYQLHVLYVGLSGKMPRSERSGTVIGVRIRDPQYQKDTPSKFATVVEVIDVGGVDVYDIGVIKL
jgi:hypothetical protein